MIVRRDGEWIKSLPILQYVILCMYERSVEMLNEDLPTHALYLPRVQQK